MALKWGLIALWSRIRYCAKFTVLNEEENDQSTPVVVTKTANQIAADMQLQGTFIDEKTNAVNYTEMNKSELFVAYHNTTLLLKQLTLDGLNALSNEEKLSFFINIYNALTMHALVAVERRVGSVLEIPKFWQTYAYNIAGHVFTLDDIEHGVLRGLACSRVAGNRLHPTQGKAMFAEGDPRLAIKVDFDPRIHFALVCGAKSCPPIRVYTSTNTQAALGVAAASFCNAEVVPHPEHHEVSLSMILKWYGADFGSTEHEILQRLCSYMHLSPPVPLTLAQSDPAKSALAALLESGTPVKVTYRTYDWSLNGH